MRDIHAVVNARGFDRMFERVALIVGCVALAGCAGMARQSLRPIAEHDLRCPADRLRFQDLGGCSTCNGCEMGVVGCGRQASYVSRDCRLFVWEMSCAGVLAHPPSK